MTKHVLITEGEHKGKVVEVIRNYGDGGYAVSIDDFPVRISRNHIRYMPDEYDPNKMAAEALEEKARETYLENWPTATFDGDNVVDNGDNTETESKVAELTAKLEAIRKRSLEKGEANKRLNEENNRLKRHNNLLSKELEAINRENEELIKRKEEWQKRYSEVSDRLSKVAMELVNATRLREQFKMQIERNSELKKRYEEIENRCKLYESIIKNLVDFEK